MLLCSRFVFKVKAKWMFSVKNLEKIHINYYKVVNHFLTHAFELQFHFLNFQKYICIIIFKLSLCLLQNPNISEVEVLWCLELSLCNLACHISIANCIFLKLLTIAVEWLKLLIFMSFDSWTMGKNFQNHRIWVQMLTSSWLSSWPTIGLWLSCSELVWQEDDFL